jgi:hypothetical protein
MGSTITCADAGALSLAIGSRAKGLKLLAAATLLLASAGTASAVSVTGTYTITYDPNKGGHPSFSNPSSSSGPRLTSGTHFNTYTDTGSFSIDLTPNASATSYVNFFQIDPSGSCGSGCDTAWTWHNGYKDYYYTQSGTVSVTFNIASALPSQDFTATGLYQARYGGPILGCASTANSPSYGDTDCINWNGDPNPLHIALAGDQTLIIGLQDAEDWSILPKINFQLNDNPHTIPGTPIPGALPLFMSGAGVFGVIGWRRKKRMTKQAGANA